MRSRLFFFLFLIPIFSKGQIEFDNFFIKKSFRFDFMIGGNYEEVTIYPRQMKQEPFWAGSVINTIDTFHYGSFRFRIFDVEKDILIFSKGFNTLFQEWQSTPEAKKENRVFYQCVVFPFPKERVRLEIEARNWQGEFNAVYSTEIDPDNYFIVNESTALYETRVLEEYGNPQEKIDLVILAEGYKQEEMDKFLADVRRITGYLFGEEPFKSAKRNFNIRAVLSASVESGTDIPGEGIYKNTLFNSSFYTFDVDRYLTATDIKSIYDAAATVPYDQIYVLVNSKRYGGGGIFNFLNICTSDNPLSEMVFLHEFGHGFAGLGDEYYSSSVAYDDYYNLEIEPWEPNLTTLVNFDAKWASKVHDSIPVPTPRISKYTKSVGVYEGGGYQTKGIFSPYILCRMKSNDAIGFCPICSDAVQRMIDFHCK